MDLNRRSVTLSEPIITMSTTEILQEIKRRVSVAAPTAEVVLYGSYARGDQQVDSDIDLLILVDAEKVDHELESSITHPLYHLEYATGTIISPRVISKKEWYSRPFVTPFFLNVEREGRRL